MPSFVVSSRPPPPPEPEKALKVEKNLRPTVGVLSMTELEGSPFLLCGDRKGFLSAWRIGVPPQSEDPESEQPDHHLEAHVGAVHKVTVLRSGRLSEVVEEMEWPEETAPGLGSRDPQGPRARPTTPPSAPKPRNSRLGRFCCTWSRCSRKLTLEEEEAAAEEKAAAEAKATADAYAASAAIEGKKLRKIQKFHWLVCTAGEDGALRFWRYKYEDNMDRDGVPKVLEVDFIVQWVSAGGLPIEHLQEVHDGYVAVGLKESADVFLVDPVTASVKTVLFGHTSPVSCLAECVDGRLLSGGADGAVRLWRNYSWAPAPRKAPLPKPKPMLKSGPKRVDSGQVSKQPVSGGGVGPVEEAARSTGDGGNTDRRRNGQNKDTLTLEDAEDSPVGDRSIPNRENSTRASSDPNLTLPHQAFDEDEGAITQGLAPNAKLNSGVLLAPKGATQHKSMGKLKTMGAVASEPPTYGVSTMAFFAHMHQEQKGESVTVSLRVFVHRAENLPKADYFSHSDPYVQCSLVEGDPGIVSARTISSHQNNWQSKCSITLRKALIDCRWQLPECLRFDFEVYSEPRVALDKQPTLLGQWSMPVLEILKEISYMSSSKPRPRKLFAPVGQGPFKDLSDAFLFVGFEYTRDGVIDCLIENAEGLPGLGVNTNTFVKVHARHSRFGITRNVSNRYCQRTRILNSNPNPLWNEMLELDLPANLVDKHLAYGPNMSILIEVFDADLVTSDDLLGSLTLPLAQALRIDDEGVHVFDLELAAGMKQLKASQTKDTLSNVPAAMGKDGDDSGKGCAERAGRPRVCLAFQTVTPCPLQLRCVVERGVALPPCSSSSSSPVVRLRLSHGNPLLPKLTVVRTATKKKTVNPVWRERCILPIPKWLRRGHRRDETIGKRDNVSKWPHSVRAGWVHDSDPPEVSVCVDVRHFGTTNDPLLCRATVPLPNALILAQDGDAIAWDRPQRPVCLCCSALNEVPLPPPKNKKKEKPHCASCMSESLVYLGFELGPETDQLTVLVEKACCIPGATGGSGTADAYCVVRLAEVGGFGEPSDAEEVRPLTVLQTNPSECPTTRDPEWSYDGLFDLPGREIESVVAVQSNWHLNVEVLDFDPYCRSDRVLARASVPVTDVLSDLACAERVAGPKKPSFFTRLERLRATACAVSAADFVKPSWDDEDDFPENVHVLGHNPEPVHREIKLMDLPRDMRRGIPDNMRTRNMKESGGRLARSGAKKLTSTGGSVARSDDEEGEVTADPATIAGAITDAGTSGDQIVAADRPLMDARFDQPHSTALLPITEGSGGDRGGDGTNTSSELRSHQLAIKPQFHGTEQTLSQAGGATLSAFGEDTRSYASDKKVPAIFVRFEIVSRWQRENRGPKRPNVKKMTGPSPVTALTAMLSSVVSGHENGNVFVWDTTGLSVVPLHRFEAHPVKITNLLHLKQLDCIVSTGSADEPGRPKSDSCVRLWNLATMDLRQTVFLSGLFPQTAIPLKLEGSADPPHLALASNTQHMNSLQLMHVRSVDAQ
eukprot:TRINITY_DN34103_c0_g1_i1.p1 TRINITY_DN34103_c0_g1~~TRINITY_DN34103_c0_g1_i1.p1  ORF type:complete len:1515 (+),score=247.19 TRINITY_DN34103_c0_g1_i1:98-4642(+)